MGSKRKKRKRGTGIYMVHLAVAVAVAAGCMAWNSSPGEVEGQVESLGPWTNRTSLGCVLFRLERGPSMSIYKKYACVCLCGALLLDALNVEDQNWGEWIG
jgi:hypothetical protein